MSSAKWSYPSGSTSDGSVSTEEVVDEFFYSRTEACIKEGINWQHRVTQKDSNHRLQRSISDGSILSQASGGTTGHRRARLPLKENNNACDFQVRSERVEEMGARDEELLWRRTTLQANSSTGDEREDIVDGGADQLAPADALQDRNGSGPSLRLRRSVTLDNLIMPLRVQAPQLQSRSSRRSTSPLSPASLVAKRLSRMGDKIDLSLVRIGLGEIRGAVNYVQYEEIGLEHFFPPGAPRCWSMVLSFLFFSHLLGVKYDMLEYAKEWTVRFAHKHVDQWIAGQGGWVSCRNTI